MLVQVILGAQMEAWECETVLTELAREGVVLSDLNAHKLFCCMALAQNPQGVRTGHLALKNAVLLMNNHEPEADRDEVVDVEQLSWGVRALEAFYAPDSLAFDYEPLQYMAKVLHGEGYVLAPNEIEWVQPLLTRLNKNPGLEAEVLAWAGNPPEDAPNGILAVQLDKLEGVKAYSEAMHAELCRYLKDLKTQFLIPDPVAH